MDFLTNPNLKNVAELSTTSSKVLVVDGASNTIKWRSPSGIVTDGGGGGSGGRSCDLTLFGASKYAISDNFEIYIADAYDDGTDPYGWPYNGNDTLEDSIKRAYKTIIPFNPTEYRITALVYTTISYSGTTPSSGTFGIEFEYSANSGSSWVSFATLGFRVDSMGDLVTVNGSLSISGSPSSIQIRCRCHNNLNNNEDGTVQVRALNASFWN